MWNIERHLRVTFRVRHPDQSMGPGKEVHGYIVGWSADAHYAIVVADGGTFYRVGISNLHAAPEMVTGGSLLPVGKAER